VSSGAQTPVPPPSMRGVLPSASAPPPARGTSLAVSALVPAGGGSWSSSPDPASSGGSVSAAVVPPARTSLMQALPARSASADTSTLLSSLPADGGYSPSRARRRTGAGLLASVLAPPASSGA